MFADLNIIGSFPLCSASCSSVGVAFTSRLTISSVLSPSASALKLVMIRWRSTGQAYRVAHHVLCDGDLPDDILELQDVGAGEDLRNRRTQRRRGEPDDVEL